jgi:hypothetical protein
MSPLEGARETAALRMLVLLLGMIRFLSFPVFFTHVSPTIVCFEASHSSHMPLEALMCQY